MNTVNNTAFPENNAVTALKSAPFRLTGGCFERGAADEFCAGITDPSEKAICEAELLYYRGFPEKARAAIRSPEMRDGADGLAALYLIDVITAIPLGDINGINTISMLISAAESIEGISAESRKTLDFVKLYFNILTHNSKEITFPPLDVNAFAVPPSLRPMAVYAFSHNLIINGDPGRAIGLAEGTLIGINGTQPVAEIYLSLIISVGYICRGEWERAEYYFMNAWNAALKDRFFMPFAELRTMLCGMLEKCLKKTFPAECRLIADLSSNYHKNWVYIHNELTGECVTDKLTVTEMNIAMLASRGLSNTEIGDFVNISVNSVRAHLRNIFEKLEITNRKDLIKFIIK